MYQQDLLRKLDLSGVAITAEVGEDGSLRPVGGAFEKLLAAARMKAFPRIHTVLVAKDQPLAHLTLIQDSHNSNVLTDPHDDLHVILASTLDDAVQSLIVEHQTRWGEIIDCVEELGDHRDFIGRDWLRKRVQTFLRGRRPPSYLLITGEPGAGKSAFVADCVRADATPVYHFIKKGRGEWDNPDAFFDSLAAQLCRKYGLPRDQHRQERSTEETFYAVLREVSNRLSEHEHEVLWLDGLDEAYGPTARFAGVALPGVLRERLPDGVFFVLTSRPGDHLTWLADPALCEQVQLVDEGVASVSDVRAYFEARNQGGGLGLSAEFIAEAVRRSENNFLFAVLLIKDLRALPPKERIPSRIPNGLRGWMVKQLEYVVDKWKDLNR